MHSSLHLCSSSFRSFTSGPDMHITSSERLAPTKVSFCFTYLSEPRTVLNKYLSFKILLCYIAQCHVTLKQIYYMLSNCHPHVFFSHHQKTNCFLSFLSFCFLFHFIFPPSSFIYLQPLPIPLSALPFHS